MKSGEIDFSDIPGYDSMKTPGSDTFMNMSVTSEDMLYPHNAPC